MTEQLKSGPESAGETMDLSAETKRLSLERAENLKAAENNETASVETLSVAAKEKAVSGAEHSRGEAPKDTSKTQYGVQKDLKDEAYANTMRRVRGQLKPTDRVASKWLHNSKVEAVSVVAAQTVARPSGLLGGGLVALIGSSIVLFMASRYGFNYNFGMFLILFVIGFALGTIVEFAGRLLHRNRA